MEIIVVLARLVIPLSILRFPLAGTFLSAVMDVVDYWYIGNQPWYQSADKLLDTYYLGFCAYVALSWKDTAAKWLALGLYGFRTLGVFIFLAVNGQSLLFFFPNLFESFFVFYLLFVRITHKDILLRSWAFAAVMLVALLIPRMFEEYTIHIYKPGAEQHLGILGPIFTLPQIASALLWLALPALALGWAVWRAKKGAG